MKIVFLGPDGVGKSTVIKSFLEKYEGELVTQYYYLVPGFMPRYRKKDSKDVVTDPHSNKQRGWFTSNIKVIYWSLEYLLGSLVYDSNEKLMVFDRYYYDILVDQKRYCFNGSARLLRLISSVIPKPKLLIVLDAPTEVIQSRKQEVPECETERQRHAYLGLAKKFENSLVLNTTDSIQINIKTITEELNRHGIK